MQVKLHLYAYPFICIPVYLVVILSWFITTVFAATSSNLFPFSVTVSVLLIPPCDLSVIANNERDKHEMSTCFCCYVPDSEQRPGHSDGFNMQQNSCLFSKSLSKFMPFTNNQDDGFVKFPSGRYIVGICNTNKQKPDCN